MHVLLVDDEPAYRLLVRDALEQAGAAVDEVANGPAALERLASLRAQGVPVVLLTDYRMDGMSGLDLVAAAHGDVHDCIVMTSHAELAERGRALDLGVPMVLKPTTAHGLQAWIRGLLADLAAPTAVRVP